MFFVFCMRKSEILEGLGLGGWGVGWGDKEKTKMQHIGVVTQELRVTALEVEILSHSFVTV